MIEPAPVLILASASPRRQALLRDAGLEFELRPPGIEETPLPGEPPAELTRRLAEEKAAAALVLGPADGRVVLAADTVVVVDGEILGKPDDAAAARAMLKRLSGRAHQVFSAFAVTDGTRTESGVVVSTVRMRPITDDEIERYVSSGEPMDKAGAYAVQGRAAAFVVAVDGSHSGVVGLPLYETLAALATFGIVSGAGGS